MSINRRPQGCIQPLQLSCARAVIQRNDIVHKNQSSDGDQEIRDDDSDQHKRANDAGWQ